RRHCRFGFRHLQQPSERRSRRASVRKKRYKLPAPIPSTTPPNCAALPTQRQSASSASHQGDWNGWPGRGSEAADYSRLNLEPHGYKCKALFSSVVICSARTGWENFLLTFPFIEPVLNVTYRGQGPESCRPQKWWRR